MPLVHQVVARFLKKLPANVLRDDLVGAGSFGLIDALRKGGANRGAAFEWYARVRIRGAILDELRTQDWLTRRARSRVKAAAASETGFRASIIGIDDLSPDLVALGLADDSRSPHTLTEQSMERTAIAAVVNTLPDRERQIVTSYYFKQVPFKTIAQHLGVSEPRVSQLHARAMQLLKDALARKGDYAAA
jgi:RNA polymerase sigma factor for flagellar operon FliA